MKNSALIFDLLNISKNVPLSEKEMAQSLKVTFQPVHKNTERLNRFTEKFKKALVDIGVKILPYEDALDHENGGKVRSGIVIIEQGLGKDDDLAIKTVSSLYHNPVVCIFDSPPPIPENPTLQETLDSIVSVLAWNLSHVPIFLHDEKWTFCTMNGAVVECGNWNNLKDDILYSLIPKLSAQVVPPKREDIYYREGVFDPIEEGYGDFIDDFMSAAKIWRDNGLMLAHTSIEELDYRNRFYKRIVSRYLDHRTGMSYGFMVKQLPTPVEPAVERTEAPDFMQNHNWDESAVLEINGDYYLMINLFDKEWIVNVPEVWLMSTRSGCNKTNLNPKKDILKLGLFDGKITIDTPAGITKQECRPSYDTYAILAHALGNVITASILMREYPSSPFPKALQERGLSVSHWHGYPDAEYPLPGYMLHGIENPPVSCSTPQSAAYAIGGKLNSLEKKLNLLDGYRGDIHVEPHHGTNITGVMSITETAAWVDKMHKHNQSKKTISN
ncbi:MAG: hypothetical protein JJU13_07135 [Balneolaceae bacterium]|nr:hypothetical protein [Balneolaceae bacterium]